MFNLFWIYFFREFFEHRVKVGIGGILMIFKLKQITRALFSYKSQEDSTLKTEDSFWANE